MPDTDNEQLPVVGGLGNLFSWNANDPSGTNYPALEARRKIALQLIARDKKGYPKNIGEGLTSLGDALGEIGMMRGLQQQEAAYQRQLNTAAPQMVPGDARTPAAAPPPAAAPAPAPGPQADTGSDDVVTSAPPPTADLMPIVDPNEVNAVDQDGTPAPPGVAQQAATTATESAQNLVRPSPYEQRPGVAYPIGSPTRAPPSWLPEQSAVQSEMTSTDPGMRIAGRPSPNQVPIAQGGMGPLPAPAAAATARSLPANAVSWHNFSTRPVEQGGLGLAPHQAAGVVGNLQQESSQNIQPWGLTGDRGTAQGAAQWRLDRLANLQQFAADRGLDYKSTDAQQQFMRHEMLGAPGDGPGGGSERGAYSRLLTAQNPQAAATMFNRYYERSADNSGRRQSNAVNVANLMGQPGGGTQTAQASPRDAIAAAMVSQNTPLGPQDAADDDRLADVVGMSKGPTGAYAYPATAMNRSSDMISDAPQPGITGAPQGPTSEAVGDTVQQRQQMMHPYFPAPLPASAAPAGPMPAPAEAVPAPNPIPAAASAFPASTATTLPPSTMTAIQAGSPRAAADNPPIVSDIKPMLEAPIPAPGAQMAQAAPPAIPKAPLTDLPQRPTPPPLPSQSPPPRPPVLEDIPMTDDEKRGYNMLARFPGDPNIAQQAKILIDYGKGQRDQEYQARLKTYESDLALRNQQTLATDTFNRGAPQRELERQAKEVEIAKAKAFGGLSEATVMKPVEDSAKAVAGIPAGQAAVRNALRVLPGIFSGSAGDIELSVKKLLAAGGFPVDPRIGATEQFKAFIMPALAAARQAQSGGANISDNDMLLAAKAVAGDIKLDPSSIKAILEQLERTNVKAAIWHQGKVEAAAGDDPQRQAVLFRSYGMPMQDLVHPDAIKLLREHPSPDIIKQFNSKYHTPGLAQQILGGGG
jgi:Phage tail lysozyme